MMLGTTSICSGDDVSLFLWHLTGVLRRIASYSCIPVHIKGCLFLLQGRHQCVSDRQTRLSVVGKTAMAKDIYLL